MRLRVVLTLAAVMMALAFAIPVAHGQSNQVEVDASLDGVALAAVDNGDPLRIESGERVNLDLAFANNTDEAVTVGRISVNGSMLGMSFLKHDTAVDIELGPGERRSLSVPLTFFDIDDDATGYLRSELVLRSTTGDQLAKQTFAIDVTGSGVSTMTRFGIGIAIVAIATIAGNLWALAARSLPQNRAVRALRFALSGLCVGILVAVLCSIWRIYPLSPLQALFTMALLTAIGYGVGMLTPGPVEITDDDVLEDILIDRAEAQALQS